MLAAAGAAPCGQRPPQAVPHRGVPDGGTWNHICVPAAAASSLWRRTADAARGARSAAAAAAPSGGGGAAAAADAPAPAPTKPDAGADQQQPGRPTARHRAATAAGPPAGMDAATAASAAVVAPPPSVHDPRAERGELLIWCAAQLEAEGEAIGRNAIVGLYARLRAAYGLRPSRGAGGQPPPAPLAGGGEGRADSSHEEGREEQEEEEEQQQQRGSQAQQQQQQPPPGGPPPTFKQVWRGLAGATLRRQEQLLPKDWAQVLYTCAKVSRGGADAAAPLTAAALRRTDGRQRDMGGAALANALWAVAVMRARPPEAWLEGACGAAAAALEELERADSGLADAGGEPPGPPPRCVRRALSRQQAVQLLWALAELGHRPPAPLITALLGRLRPRLAGLSASELTNVAWALARLRFRPERGWLRDYFEATRAALAPQPPGGGAGSAGAAAGGDNGSGGGDEGGGGEERSGSGGGGGGGGGDGGGAARGMDAHQVATLLASLAALRAAPPPAWHSALRAALRRLGPDLRPRQLALVMGSLARLRCPLPPFWLGLLAGRAAALLGLEAAAPGGGGPPEYTTWRKPPPPPRAPRDGGAQGEPPPPRAPRGGGDAPGAPRAPRPPPEALQQQARRAPAGPPPWPLADGDLAAIVWALPLLAWPDPREWAAGHGPLLRALAAAALPRLGRMAAPQLVQLVVGFGRLGFYPGLQWVKSHENAVAARHGELGDANRARLRAAYRSIWGG
ncbi:MAG: hypothetical protein J3K34DRAFT_519119 [Monoraphidium minutum]|nr:MAG: hypothetical protein J3K34DRAFT_519119 [Monoraphidium minutum]